MTKYFITGGAGFLGINLTRYLLSLGQTVVSYDIAEEYPYPEKDDENLMILTGDIRDLDLLIKSACGSDVLIHAAAALPSYSEDEIYSTDIEGTRNVFQAAVANGISRVVHISSTAVYGIVHDNPIYESDLLHGIGPYGLAKIAAEDICLEYRENGMIVPILRPVTFVGPERLGIWALLYDWATEGEVFLLLVMARIDISYWMYMICVLPFIFVLRGTQYT